MGITSKTLFLPVSVLKIDGEFKHDVSLVVLFPSYGSSDLLQSLSCMLETSEKHIIPFYEKNTGEIVRIDQHTDLRRDRAVRLRAVVGIVTKECETCEKAFNHGVVPEFHCCVMDKIISEFCVRPLAGPIERPHPAMLRGV